jgi:hypothetical protein
MALRKQTADFEGSASFEETRALFLAKYALRNPFMPQKLRAHSGVALKTH